VANKEAGPRPLIIGVSDKLDAASSALGHLDVLTLVFDDLPDLRNLCQPPLGHHQGRTPIKEENKLQGEYIFRCELWERLGGQELLQGRGTGAQDVHERFPTGLVDRRFDDGPQCLGERPPSFGEPQERPHGRDGFQKAGNMQVVLNLV
jgi:hypothetical protein